MGQFLSEQSPVTIDGRVAEGRLDRIHFVRRTLRRTGIVNPPEDLDVTSATLGVIFVYPIEALPQEVTMRWELFDERIQEVPAAATDEAGPLPSTLTPQDPVLRWRNFLKHPTIPTFATIAPPPVASTISIPLVTLICIFALVPLGAMIFHSFQRVGKFSRDTSLVWLTVAIVGGVAYPHARIAVARPFTPLPLISDTEATEVLGGLLHNVYRAFDKRDQSLIYDQLARSIAGDLLERVYLDTRKSIEVENQGGLQIKVDDVTILDLQRISANQPSMQYQCSWCVSGSVGHWGHIHRRVNEPTAQITMAAIDGSWKIVAMEMTSK